MPSDIADDILEQSVCQALSLTGISAEPDDLQACHRMRKKTCKENLDRKKINK